MYVDIADTELKRVELFEVGKEYYHKNGNGNWYKGKLKSLDYNHFINTADGLKPKRGFEIDDYVGIHDQNELFELGVEYEIPTIPTSLRLGDRLIRIQDIPTEDLSSVVRRWGRELIDDARVGFDEEIDYGF